MGRIQDGVATVIGRLFGSARPAQDEAAGDPRVPPVTPVDMTSADASSAPGDAFYLDVRAALAEGREPLGEIMQLARRVPDGGMMTLEAPFNPIPLRRMLNESGFQDEAWQVAPAHWRIVFRRTSEAVPAKPGAARIWHAPDAIHIDVRGLAPPAPMVEILKLVDSCSAITTIAVHHEREPVFLYPELAQRGWSHTVTASQPDEVMLLLRREARS
ncbi:MAG: DUF2249 domain-containing protein [Xanthobacteraceae bacterium]|nr:MAG: DUF2249 domain-containing protein [Xanthobacteraceae bacterium]